MATKEQAFLKSQVELISQQARIQALELLDHAGIQTASQSSSTSSLDIELPMQQQLPNEPSALPEDISPSSIIISDPTHLTHGEYPRIDTIVDFRFTDISRRGYAYDPQTLLVSSERYRLLKLEGYEWLSRIDHQVGTLVVGADSSHYMHDADGSVSETKKHTRPEQAKEVKAFSQIALKALEKYLERNPARFLPSRTVIL